MVLYGPTWYGSLDAGMPSPGVYTIQKLKKKKFDYEHLDKKN